MAIEYGTNENWRWKDESVEFSVNDSGREILCRVSYECIRDNFDERDNFNEPLGMRECLALTKARFDKITDLVGEKIARAQFEEDGTVLIRSSDW